MVARVLFVDDEPKILQGLKRMLRGVRKEWDLAFVEGGREALADLAETPAAAVVSDMRMPGMDGGELLNEVQERHPGVMRFVLSGQCDEDTMFRLVGNSHQFLSKPCDPDKLIGTLRRALDLRALLERDDIRALVSGLRFMPCPSVIHAELLAALGAAEPSLDRVAEIVARDTALSLKVLQLCNSAYFGTGAAVRSPAQAVRVLGFDTIKTLVLTHDIVPKVEGNQPYDRVWHHCSIAGRTARAFAEAEQLAPAEVENAVVGGLLHDIGALLLAARRPDDYAKVIATSPQETPARLELEREIFGATHAEVGAYLAGLWGLPDSVVEAIAYHHEPSKAGSKSFGVLAAVHLAEGLTQISQYGADPEAVIDQNYLAAIGLTERLPVWLDRAKGILAEEPPA